MGNEMFAEWSETEIYSERLQKVLPIFQLLLQASLLPKDERQRWNQVGFWFNGFHHFNEVNQPVNKLLIIRLSSAKKGDANLVESKSPNLANATGSETSSDRTLARNVRLTKKAEPIGEFAPDELRPLQSSVVDHKIKSVKGSSKEPIIDDRAHLAELDRSMEDKSEAIESLLEESTETPTVDLVPQPNDLDKESEPRDPVGESSQVTSDASGTFYQAIRKMISTGGGLDKLKKKQEYLGYLETIKSYGKQNATEESKDAAGAGTEFVKVEAKSDDAVESDLDELNVPLDRRTLLADFEESSATISASCSESSLNSNLPLDLPAKESDDPAQKPSVEKTKKPKKPEEDPGAFNVSNAMNMAIYGTAGTILSAALYYLINR